MADHQVQQFTTEQLLMMSSVSKLISGTSDVSAVTWHCLPWKEYQAAEHDCITLVHDVPLFIYEFVNSIKLLRIIETNLYHHKMPNKSKTTWLPVDATC